MHLAALALPVLVAFADNVAPQPIEKEAVVAAPRSEVFAAWTTPEGLRSFFAPTARVELRLGGPFEIEFSSAAPEGSRGSEGCRVLSFLPGRMVSFSWSAPPMFPEERAQRTFVVVELLDAESGTTRVRLTHAGFGTGGRWDDVRKYFDSAWVHVLDNLKKRFTTGPIFPSTDAPPAIAPKTFFVVLLRPKDMAAVQNPDAAGKTALAGHVAHIKSLAAEGRLVVAGPSLVPAGEPPFGGPALGILVFSAKDEADARRTMEADPMVKAGLFEGTLRPFNLSFERP